MWCAHRAAAAGCLADLSVFMERVYASICATTRTTVPIPCCHDSTDLAGFYGFAFATAQPKERTFTIQATPAGVQATNDAACGTLSINHQHHGHQRRRRGPSRLHGVSAGGWPLKPTSRWLASFQPTSVRPCGRGAAG